MKRTYRSGLIAMIMLVVVMVGAVSRALVLGPAEPDGAEIQRIINERVDRNYNVSIVVAVVGEGGTEYYTAGKLAKGSSEFVDENTLYEIGSVTKTFTAIMLADQIERREMNLNDPVDKYLPEGVHAPSYGGQKIRLVNLVTHTSGLPTMPTNVTITDDNRPYANFTAQKLYEFLNSYKLTRKIGSQFEYSNVGVGLVGHILARKAGKSYEDLVVSKVCDPLGMTSTRITLSPQLRRRMATGYNVSGAAVPDWTMSVLTGAGDLRSSARDMAKYVAANLGLKDTKLAAAINRSHQVVSELGFKGAQTAMCWQVFEKDGRQIIIHPGGTRGFRSIVAFDKQHKRGVVALTNSAYDVQDIAVHILVPSLKLKKIIQEITIDSAILNRYVGLYRILGGVVFEFKREGDALMVYQQGAPKYRIYPESPTTFFYKDIEAKFTFEKDKRGAFNKIVLHQFGREMPGQRISQNELRKEIDIDPAILDDYVGLFQFGPNLRFEFVKEDDKLMVKQGGAPKLQIYPESQTKFFYKVVDAQFTFVRDQQGKVNRVILHQFGRDMTGKRVK